MPNTLPLTVQASLAPQNLWQDILPWVFNQPGMQFGLVNVSLGRDDNSCATGGASTCCS